MAKVALPRLRSPARSGRAQHGLERKPNNTAAAEAAVLVTFFIFVSPSLLDRA